MNRFLSLTIIVIFASSLCASMPEQVLVNRGSFLMGTTWREEGVDYEPVRRIHLNYDFYIGKFEVTFEEYEAFCDETGRILPDDSGWGKGARPVMNVSWTVKQLMINWRGNKLQKKLLSEIADVIILVLKFIALFIRRTVLTNWLDSFQHLLVVALPKELAMFSK